MDREQTQAYIHTAKAALTFIGGWVGWFLGDFDGFLYALVVFTLVDYATGVLCAVAERRLSSSVGTRGIAKKIAIFALVGVGHTVDAFVIGQGNAVRTAVIFFFLSNEGISLLENSTRLGLPVPQALKDTLSQLHARLDR